MSSSFFSHFVWHNKFHQWNEYSFTSLIKPILLLCWHKGFHIKYLDYILVLNFISMQAREQDLSVLLVGSFWLHINFSKSEPCITQCFCFLGLFWKTVPMSVFLPLRCSSWLIACHRHSLWQSIMSCLLGQDNLCSSGHAQFCQLRFLILSNMLKYYVFGLYFGKSELYLTQCFCFLGLLWCTVHLSELVSLRYSSWLIPCYRHSLWQSIMSCLLGQRKFMFQWTCTILPIVLSHLE